MYPTRTDLWLLVSLLAWVIIINSVAIYKAQSAVCTTFCDSAGTCVSVCP